jgi:RNA polymerase sigma factor (sigma-70 family)
MNGEQEKCDSRKILERRQQPAGGLSDEALLLLVREGNERAFETLLLRYRRPLRSYCVRLGAADAAEDVLQQVMLEAWLALRGGAQVSSFKAWLFAIAHNVCLDTIAAAPRIADLPSGEAEMVARTQPALLEPNLAETLTAVAELPLLQREAIVRTALAGESYEQVGHYLGLTAGAVRGLIHRGRATLRSALAGLVPPWLTRLIASRSGPAAGVRESLLGLAYGTSSDSSAGALVKAGVIAAAAAAAITTAMPIPADHSHARHRRAASRLGGRTVAPSVGGGLDGSAIAARGAGAAAAHRRPATRSSSRSRPLRTLEVVGANSAGTGAGRSPERAYADTTATRTAVAGQPATVDQTGVASAVSPVEERTTSSATTSATSASAAPSPSQPPPPASGESSSGSAGGETGTSGSGSSEQSGASSGSSSGGGLVGEVAHTVEKTLETTIEATVGKLLP